MTNEPKHTVILGGGFAGLFTALELSGKGPVTLVCDEDHFLFTPMLYEYVSGEVEAWHIAPKYGELLDGGVEWVKDAVAEVDLENRQESWQAERTFRTTYLVLALGGVTNYAGVEGAEEYSIPFRKLRHADRLRQTMVEALDHVPPDLAATGRTTRTYLRGRRRRRQRCRTIHQDGRFVARCVQAPSTAGESRVMVIEMGDRVVPGMGDEIREFVEDALLQVTCGSSYADASGAGFCRTA